MRSLYIILSVIGWVWTAVFFIAYFWNARRRKLIAEQQRGFDVVSHEKQL